jgi:hypothetical protein
VPPYVQAAQKLRRLHDFPHLAANHQEMLLPRLAGEDRRIRKLVDQGASRTSRTDAIPRAIPSAASASTKPSLVFGSRPSRSAACSSR